MTWCRRPLETGLLVCVVVVHEWLEHYAALRAEPHRQLKIMWRQERRGQASIPDVRGPPTYSVKCRNSDHVGRERPIEG